MSIEKFKNLEDLKEKASKINSARSQITEGQRPLAIQAALKEMGDYLLSQDFSLTHLTYPERDFNAVYKEIELNVTATEDSEHLIGADYNIFLASGSKKLTVTLNLNRGTRVNPALAHGTIDDQISDYENRYIPELESLSSDELDGSYTLSAVIKINGQNKQHKFKNGKEVIDKFFEA